MAIDSKRKYLIMGVTGNGHHESVTDTVHQLLQGADAEEDGNDFEYRFAAQEISDDILDLKVNESMYYQPNRDDKDSKAIILRIK